MKRNVNNYQRITIIGIDISIGEHATTHAHLHKLCLLRRSCFTHQLTPDVTCLHWSHTHTHTHSHKHQTHAIHTLRINCFADIAIHNTKVYVWIKKSFFCVPSSSSYILFRYSFALGVLDSGLYTLFVLNIWNCDA